jgi:hypothetical protein
MVGSFVFTFTLDVNLVPGKHGTSVGHRYGGTAALRHHTVGYFGTSTAGVLGTGTGLGGERVPSYQRYRVPSTI